MNDEGLEGGGGNLASSHRRSTSKRELLRNSSPRCRLGNQLPVDKAHWLELELTPESLQSLNTDR